MASFKNNKQMLDELNRMLKKAKTPDQQRAIRVAIERVKSFAKSGRLAQVPRLLADTPKATTPRIGPGSKAAPRLGAGKAAKKPANVGRGTVTRQVGPRGISSVPGRTTTSRAKAKLIEQAAIKSGEPAGKVRSLVTKAQNAARKAAAEASKKGLSRTAVKSAANKAAGGVLRGVPWAAGILTGARIVQLGGVLAVEQRKAQQAAKAELESSKALAARRAKKAKQPKSPEVKPKGKKGAAKPEESDAQAMGKVALGRRLTSGKKIQKKKLTPLAEANLPPVFQGQFDTDDEITVSADPLGPSRVLEAQQALRRTVRGGGGRGARRRARRGLRRELKRAGEGRLGARVAARKEQRQARKQIAREFGLEEEERKKKKRRS